MRARERDRTDSDAALTSPDARAAPLGETVARQSHGYGPIGAVPISAMRYTAPSRASRKK